MNVNQQKSRQLRYFSRATILEESHTSKFIIIGILLVSTILFSFIVWSAITPIEEIAVTYGEVIPKGRPFVVQHLEGGLVSRIYVKDGDEVQRNQLLVTLDPTPALAELEQVESRLAGLGLSPDQLRAFIASHNPKEVTEELTRLSDKNLFFTSRIDNLEKKLILQKKELAMYESLANRGFVSQRDYLAAQRAVNDTIGDIGKAKAEQLELIQSVKKLKDKVKRIEIRSPVHGLVQGLQAKSGSVIQPGGTLLEIIPLNEELVVETKIATTDIGHIKVGNPVKVKVRAFDYSRYGGVQGTLTNISATTFSEPSEEKKTTYYKGIITLAQQYVGDNKNFRLVPGMTVEADINTGTKTLLQYLLKPIHATLTSSFHER